ncbi:MAG: COG4280 domain-containing protein [Acidimicrobiales bacterium]
MSTTSTTLMLVAVFGASTVEMVEALTIVVAAGVTRGWRSALEGAAAAVLVLALVVGAVGVPLIRYVPLSALRIVVGALLLVLGMSWLRKAILRASGHLELHDEEAIFSEETTGLRQDHPAPARRRDGVGFAVAFKGVLLEGVEVVLIVISLGASDHRLGPAAAAAGAAAVVVAGVGALVSRQLSEVPENSIKMVVGVALTSFGLFWVGEGAGVHWPGSDLAIPVFIGVFSMTSLVAVTWLRRLPGAETAGTKETPHSSGAVAPDDGAGNVVELEVDPVVEP